MSATKEDLVTAMRQALEAYYTRRPSAGMANVPLAELADAVLAAQAGVDIGDLTPTVPQYDPELTPALRWNAPGAQLGEISYGVGVRREERTSADPPYVVIQPYEGDYHTHDGDIRLTTPDAQAFALAVLASARGPQPRTGE